MNTRPRKATPSKIAARGRRHARDRDNQASDVSWAHDSFYMEVKCYSKDAPFNQEAYEVARFESFKILFDLKRKGLAVQWGEDLDKIIRQARQSQD